MENSARFVLFSWFFARYLGAGFQLQLSINIAAGDLDERKGVQGLEICLFYF